jgi:hypothetical protein
MRCPICREEIIRPNSLLLSMDTPYYLSVYIHKSCENRIDELTPLQYKKIFDEGQKIKNIIR